MTDRYQLRQLDLGGAAPLAVGDWAGDAGPVLGIHGISSTHKLWSWTAAQLPGTRLVAPDLRGRGGSLGAGGPYTLNQHADDMLRVLDALDIERATVAGMSLGGFIAVTLAAKAPDRVSDLLLVDGGLPMRSQTATLTRDQLPVIFASRLERVKHPYAAASDYIAFFRESMGGLLDAGDTVLDDYLHYDLAGDAPDLNVRLDPNALLDDSADLFFGDTASTALEQLTTPTRLLYAEWSLGKGSPAAYTEETLAPWREKLPSFEATLVPGTDHASIVMTTAGATAIAAELAQLTAVG